MNNKKQTDYSDIIKTVLICLLAACMLYIANGCAPLPLCPDTDVILLTNKGAIKLDKGFLNDPNNFYTEKEYQERLKKTIRAYDEKLEGI